MTETIFTADNNFEKPKMPGTLNVITILTIIWCVITILLSGWGFISSKTSYDKKEETLEKMQSAEMPSWAKSMMPNAANYDTMITKSYENRVPILVLGLLAAGLCLAGAVQMRKLKKQGYLLYMIGELLPLFTTAFFIGTFMLTGTWAMVGIAITILFIILYTSQRKYLVY